MIDEKVWYWSWHWDYSRGQFRTRGILSPKGHGICYLYDQWFDTDLKTLNKIYNGQQDLIAAAPFTHWQH